MRSLSRARDAAVPPVAASSAGRRALSIGTAFVIALTLPLEHVAAAPAGLVACRVLARRLPAATHPVA
jgi:hypothetical protein